MTATIYRRPTGELVQYVDGKLHVKSGDPEVRATLRMRRIELLVFGLRCVWAAVKAEPR